MSAAVLSVTGLLLIGAFVITLASAIGRAPLWVAVLLIVLALLVGMVPVR